jgi:hypothetical protein
MEERRKEREERIDKEIEAERLGKPIRVSKEDMANYIRIAAARDKSRDRADRGAKMAASLA